MIRKCVFFAFLISILQYQCEAQSLVEAVGKAKLFKKDKAASCKPKTNYTEKKKKFVLFKSKKNTKASTTPYKYVYNSKPTTPPPSSPKTTTERQVAVKTDNSKSTQNITSTPVVTASSKSPTTPLAGTTGKPTSLLKDMPPEKRRKEVLNMPPTRELSPIRFISAQDEFSVVNMDSFMEALELINQGEMVLIEGHTDDKGSDEYNLKLSMKRVEKIRQLLLEAGADDNLISVMGYGERKPIVPNVTDADREINRRIEFKIFDLD